MTDQDSSAGTILDELVIDIYANPVMNEVVILIDRPFAAQITGLTFDKTTKNLDFLFGDMAKPLGAPLKDDIAPYFLNRNKIDICQMDIKTKTPVANMTVPLKVTG